MSAIAVPLSTTATWRTPFDRMQVRARLHPEVRRLHRALFEVHDRKHVLAAEHAHDGDCFFQVVEASMAPYVSFAYVKRVPVLRSTK